MQTMLVFSQKDLAEKEPEQSYTKNSTRVDWAGGAHRLWLKNNICLQTRAYAIWPSSELIDLPTRDFVTRDEFACVLTHTMQIDRQWDQLFNFFC